MRDDDEYQLPDGPYDCILLGTGLVQSILAG